MPEKWLGAAEALMEHRTKSRAVKHGLKYGPSIMRNMASQLRSAKGDNPSTNVILENAARWWEAQINQDQR